MEHFGLKVNFEDLDLVARQAISSCYKRGNLTGYFPTNSKCNQLDHIIAFAPNDRVLVTDLLESYYSYLKSP